MNYGDLIGNAFLIAWRNRYLWFFGFFIGGGVGYFNFSVPRTPIVLPPEVPPEVFPPG
jgi:hypothetical protein